jgi:hypothetical protein
MSQSVSQSVDHHDQQSTMATTEPTDLNHPHPGQRVNIEELAARKFSQASTSSTSSSKRPSTASSNGGVGATTDHPEEGTWKDLTTSETWSQKQQGIEIRDFATAKPGAGAGVGKSKADVEKSRRMLEKSSIV